MQIDEYQALEMEAARLSVIRYLGNGRWHALGILRRLLAMEGYPITRWDGDQWMRNILDSMVDASTVERRESHIDMPDGRFLVYYEYRLPPNADGSDHVKH